MHVRQSLTVCGTLLLLNFIATVSGCVSDRHPDHSAYIEEVTEWRKDRVAGLRGPRSWLSLIGRYPLKEGANSIGSLDTNDIVLPGKEKENIGTVVVDSAGLIMLSAPGISILHDDGSLFKSGRIDMQSPPYLHVDALYWTFLERAGKYYFRLWDTLSPARNALHEIPNYPIAMEWKIDVTFAPADSGTMIILDDIQGEKRPNAVEGYISGAWQDTVFTLMALDGGAEELFIIIEDATTDIETYPGGRYVYIPRADSSGRTMIDFNKAYTPPCAFTEFATCLLPPSENRLPFAVTAGEKVMHE